MRRKTYQKIQAPEIEPQIDLNRMQVQKDYIYCPDKFPAFCGGFGVSKTTALIIRGLFLSQIPNNLGFIGRMDGKDLRTSTMKAFFDIVPPGWITNRNDQMGLIRLANGSEVIYGDLKDISSLKNTRLGWFALEQAEEIPDETVWNFLVARLRRWIIKGEAVRPHYGFLVANPEGHNWIWKLWHPDSHENKIDKGYKLFEATTYDALQAGFVSKEFVDDLEAVYPDYMRDRYLGYKLPDGKSKVTWDAFEGRIYPDFDQTIHCISDHLIPKDNCIMYEAIDPGYTNPLSCTQYWLDEFGNTFVTGEQYEANKPIKHHASIIKNQREGRTPQATYIGDDAFAKKHSKDEYLFSDVDEWNAYGIFPIKYQGTWSAGHQRILEALKVDPRHLHPITGELGAPYLYIGKSCRHTIEEMLTYSWKKKRATLASSANPEEPQDGRDHSMDQMAGFFSSHAPMKERTIHQKPKVHHPLLTDDEPVMAGSWKVA